MHNIICVMCLLMFNILMCVCVKFLPSTMERKGAGEGWGREPEVLINYKLSLQRCNGSSKPCS